MLRLQDLRRSSCNRLSKIYNICSTQKIYYVVAKIKRNQMQGRNTVEKVLCLSAQRGYTVFHEIVRRATYNMPLLEVVGMTPTGKNFTVATAFMCNEQATTYRWVFQQIRHLYFTSVMSNGQGSIINEGEPLIILTDRERELIPLIDDGLDISSVAFWGKDNEPHLALKKIMDELKKVREMVEEPGGNCLHYLRKSHGLPCACELVHRCQYLILIREEDVDIFWRKLEIGFVIPKEHDRDMDSEMRDLTLLIMKLVWV
ncbi:hypothetical protein M9H77_11465 [Catharanthus roseus]|uniref:Uncharacterized protein n=1 Tax=Catharanthus roseus TaxID=4058 RepID=A0ACC0BEL8_CATRO|nr:hypothetical protein M9H77_11465 [Catharanthus roseus]